MYGGCFNGIFSSGNGCLWLIHARTWLGQLGPSSAVSRSHHCTSSCNSASLALDCPGTGPPLLAAMSAIPHVAEELSRPPVPPQYRRPRHEATLCGTGAGERARKSRPDTCQMRAIMAQSGGPLYAGHDQFSTHGQRGVPAGRSPHFSHTPVALSFSLSSPNLRLGEALLVASRVPWSRERIKQSQLSPLQLS